VAGSAGRARLSCGVSCVVSTMRSTLFMRFSVSASVRTVQLRIPVSVWLWEMANPASPASPARFPSYTAATTASRPESSTTVLPMSSSRMDSHRSQLRSVYHAEVLTSTAFSLSAAKALARPYARITERPLSVSEKWA